MQHYGQAVNKRTSGSIQKMANTLEGIS